MFAVPMTGGVVRVHFGLAARRMIYAGQTTSFGTAGTADHDVGSVSG